MLRGMGPWPTAESIREAIEVLRKHSLSDALSDGKEQGTYWNGLGVLRSFPEGPG